MATITGYTAARMQEIENSAVVSGTVVAGNLILTQYDGTTIDAGPVEGPMGPIGPEVDLSGMRFRGYGANEPITDLQVGDVFFKEA